MKSMRVMLLAAASLCAQSGLEDFGRNVDRYMTLEKKAERALPKLKPTDSAASIARHERALAAEIRKDRASAHRGDIFTQPVEAEFRQLIAAAMQGRKAERIHHTLKHGEPVRVRLRVNDTYPANLPRQTMPPTLLLHLPALPKELAYTIIGRDLVLQDVKANLIVDFIPNAIPPAAP